MAEQVIVKPHISFGPDVVETLQNVVCGNHIQDFLEYQKIESHLDDEGVLNLRNSACDILSYCNAHNAVNNVPTTHLVVGYVQSGKTMSFTSLIELALDNHYKMVVVLAGITTNLLDQTDDRLGDDLVCGLTKNYKHFKIHKNPDETKAKEIARNLKLKDSIVVINVLKHPSRINKVVNLLNDSVLKEFLKDEVVLIIDDEADQASLNNFGRANSRTNDEDAQRTSSTYESIITLRNNLPGNSYVQYTATPQANILINTLDMLSPKTHTLLTPGKGYCGGKLFFGVGEEGKRFGSLLIKEIPDDQVFNSKRNPLQEMPDSLEEALLLHVWAVIINTRHYECVGQLSMMVHSDVTLQWNSTFYTWINDKLTEWSEIIDSPNYSVGKYILEQKFMNAFTEAAKLYTHDSSVTYENLKCYIPEVLNDTRVYLITGDSNDMEELDWDQYSSNILVGAQMLNRGFTVKNLATTYMPRYTLGITNADTIEQRCRFFGYKEKYIRSCRVFLPQVSIDNYRHYIESEEELRLIMSETKSLEQCGHKILSYPRLNPTRNNILPISIVNTRLEGMKSFSPYNSKSIISYNNLVLDSFIDDYKDDIVPFKRNGYDVLNYDSAGYRVHSMFRVPVEKAVYFLKRFQFGNTADYMAKGDTIRYLLYLNESKLITNVAFVIMSNGKTKERTLDMASFTLLNSSLFNGPSQAGDTTHAYLGDSKMYVDDTITIQLHRLSFANLNGTKASSIAIYYPQDLSVRYISTY